MLNSCCIKIVFINRCLFKFRWYSVCRLANRPGMARIVPELTHGVLCPGRGSFCPGNVKIDHRAWIYGCSLMSVLYFVSCLSVTHDLTLNLFLWKCTKTVATRAAPFGWDMHQIVCRLGVRPRPHWGGAQWEKRREGRGKRKEGKEGEWSERSPGMPKSRVGKPICVFCTIFLLFYVFYSFLSSFTFHCNSVRLTFCIKGYLTWLEGKGREAQRTLTGEGKGIARGGEKRESYLK